MRQGTPRKQRQKSRRKIGVRDRRLFQKTEQRLGIGPELARGDDHLGTMDQRVEKTEYACIESERRELKPAGSRPTSPKALQRLQEKGKIAALEDDAFRIAGRAGGVNHVRHTIRSDRDDGPCPRAELGVANKVSIVQTFATPTASIAARVDASTITVVGRASFRMNESRSAGSSGSSGT